MKLTKELYDKIIEAWNYNAAASCDWAQREIDFFVNGLISGLSLEIEENNQIIKNLPEFIIWKNRNWILKQISVCNDFSKDKKIEIINELNFIINANKIKFNETNPHENCFNISLQSGNDSFNVYLGKLTELDDIPAYTLDITKIIFEKNSIQIDIDSDRKMKFNFEKLEIR
jgi:hypothetical protein